MACLQSITDLSTNSTLLIHWSECGHVTTVHSMGSWTCGACLGGTSATLLSRRKGGGVGFGEPASHGASPYILIRRFLQSASFVFFKSNNKFVEFSNFQSLFSSCINFVSSSETSFICCFKPLPLPLVFERKNILSSFSWNE